MAFPKKTATKMPEQPAPKPTAKQESRPVVAPPSPSVAVARPVEAPRAAVFVPPPDDEPLNPGPPEPVATVAPPVTEPPPPAYVPPPPPPGLRLKAAPPTVVLEYRATIQGGAFIVQKLSDGKKRILRAP